MRRALALDDRLFHLIVFYRLFAPFILPIYVSFLAIVSA